MEIAGSSRYISRKLYVMVTCLLALTTNQAKADGIDSLTHYDLNDVVVVGMKEQAPLKTLPVSATTIKSDDLSRNLVVGIKDLTGLIPNFIMLDRDTPHTSSVFIRGTGSLLSSSIVMYVDGVPHFEKTAFDLNINDVEKIEVLRGPQGTLFGRNAMGGTILIQTRSPFKYQGTNLSLKYGSYNELEAKASHLGRINDKWAYSLAGNYRHFGGFIPNAHLGGKADEANNGSVNAKLEWRPTDSSMLRLTNNLDIVHQGAFTYGVVDPETMFVGEVSLDHPSAYTRKIYDAGLQYTLRTTPFQLRSQLSMQLLNGNYDVDQDGSKDFIFYAVQGERQHLYSGEVAIIGNNHGWFNWSAGIFGFYHQIDRTIDVTTPGSLTHRLHDERTYGIAAFKQTTFTLFDKIRLEIGTRFDFENGRQDYTEEKTPKNKPTQTIQTNSNLKFSQFTPKVSLQFLISNDAHLYATVAKGYVTGGFNPVVEEGLEHTYGPESSWNFEAGAKGWIIPSRLYGEVALYAIDTRNKQLKMIIDGRGVHTYNAGRAMSKGIEASVNAHITREWQLNLSYGLTHATFTDYVYSDKVDYTGNFIPFVPRNTVAVNTTYALPIKNSRIIDSIDFTIGYKGIGDIYWKEDNIAKQDFYSLLDASIRAHKGKLSYSVWGTNLTNTKYLGYYYTSMKKNFGKPGRPLMMGVSVIYGF